METPTDSQKFDAVMRKILPVSKDELGEASYLLPSNL
jgi:hypothetical protein